MIEAFQDLLQHSIEAALNNSQSQTPCTTFDWLKNVLQLLKLHTVRLMHCEAALKIRKLGT